MSLDIGMYSSTIENKSMEHALQRNLIKQRQRSFRKYERDESVNDVFFAVVELSNGDYATLVMVGKFHSSQFCKQKTRSLSLLLGTHSDCRSRLNAQKSIPEC